MTHEVTFNDALPGFIIVFVIPTILYFLPTLVGFFRRHNQRWPILLFNLFLGWTFVGWVIALVWSATSDVRKRLALCGPLRRMVWQGDAREN